MCILVWRMDELFCTIRTESEFNRFADYVDENDTWNKFYFRQVQI